MKVNSKYEKMEGDIFHYNFTDYKIGNISGFRNFDGKQKDIVCIGAAQTAGRFVNYDYPSLIENNSDYSVANLGWGGAGINKYDTEEFIQYINNAKILIYQIMSGRSTKNLHTNFNIDNLLVTDIPKQIDDLYKNDYDQFIKCFKKNSTEYLRESESFRSKIKIPVIYIYVSTFDISSRNIPLSNIENSKLIYSFPHLITHDVIKKLVGNDKLGCFLQARFHKLPKKPNNFTPTVSHSDIFTTDRYYPDQNTHYDIAEFCIRNISDVIWHSQQ